ncbi:MAG: CehA/McbA family metallohydrolase [Planctomycetaceae bacterium]
MQRLAFCFALLLCSSAVADRETALKQLRVSEQKFNTPESWRHRRAVLREEFLKGAQLWPLPKRPTVEAIVNERRVYKDYSVENVALETLPGFYCTGNLYRPVGRKDAGPIVLCPHGHFRPLGRFRESQQIRCAHLARMGATVFSYSLVGWQDCDQTTHDDPLVLALQTWNSLRAVDFLTSLPRVDGRRIGVTGASGGGTQAVYLSLIDDRITALAPLVIVYPWTEDQGCQCEGGLPVMTAAETNAVELAAACSPKPQLLISVGSDSTSDFPQVGFPFIQNRYALAKAGDAVQNLHLPDEDHDFGPTKRKAVYEFFAKHLKMTPDEFSAPEKAGVDRFDAPPEDVKRITIEPPERMIVFTEEHPRPAHSVQGSDAVATVFHSYLTQLRDADSAAEKLAAEKEVVDYSFKDATDRDEALIFTPPGFDKPGLPKVAQGNETATLNISVVDSETQQPTHCRINVVGRDGNYYEPADNIFTQFSFTGEWPTSGWGNRKGKAPIRYLGRFFYSDGSAQVVVPAGTVRIEVWKGFEYRPVTFTTSVLPGQTKGVSLSLEKTVAMDEHGYVSGDAHIHIQRLDDDDDRFILGLMQAEDIHFGSILAYNEPAGPYSGFMKRMDAPQRKGTGAASTTADGEYVIQSGQEYRSSNYGHINFYLLDDLVMAGHDNNADNWPPFGHVSQLVREAGGVSFYAHGGYAKEIYADVVQGNVDGVELLQFGVYRGIGLTHWYHMLNTGFRVPAMGACDYPACRKLGDCKTYVSMSKELLDSERSSYGAGHFEAWTRAMAQGRSFFTNGPLVLFTVDDHPPGEHIDVADKTTTVTARVRVRSEVAPVTNVQLIANGRVLREIEVPMSQGQGSWIEFEVPVTIEESTWLAARAFSLSALRTPDAEAHTNPVYVYVNRKAPYEQASLDVLVTAIDSQIAFHKKRRFEEQAKVIAYFEKSRDILMKIRENGGAASTGHPSDLSVTQAMINDPGKLQHSDDELRKFLKPVPAKPLADVLKSFETVDGFEMQLVAGEPLVNDPIAGCFDEDGNLYVCEMRDYPYKPAEGQDPIGTVRLLRDTNGDGTFDESHVFADKLLWAGGVAPWKGGVYVAAAPDIWYLKDTDGDYKADVRRKVYTGFGMGNQQAMLNNLTWWLDHCIYGSTAGNGGLVSYADSKLAGSDPISVSGRDFRFHPVNDRFESITGTVQFGTTFDDWGNRFLCSESRPLLHAVLPQHYLERNPFLPVTNGLQNLTDGAVPCYRISPLERWRMIRSSRRIAQGARSPDAAGASHHVIDAAAGVTVYRGGAYPPEYSGNIFIGGAQNNLIHRRTLSPDGVGFTSDRADEGTEFVRSSDNWFRPVNFMNAPDGTLYVLDMSREILETIHVPLDVTKFLDFRSGRDHGRIYRIAPEGFDYPGPPSLSDASTEELVRHLESPHGWYRDTAHRLLYERQDQTAVPLLRTLLRESRRPVTRLYALYSLDGFRNARAGKASPRIPPTARRSGTELTSPGRPASATLAVADLKHALTDPHPQVREHAMRLAEPLLTESPELLAMVIEQAGSNDRRLRFQAAFSLGEADAASAAKALSQLAKNDGADAWMRTAVLSSSSKLAASMLAELLCDETFAASSAGQTFLRELATVIGGRNDARDVNMTLTLLAVTPRSQQALSRSLLKQLGSALRSSGNRFDESALSESAASHLQSVRTSAQAALADNSASDAVRIDAVEWLSCWPLSVVGESLQSVFDTNAPEPVQLAAIDSLATYPDVSVGESFINRWPEYSPALKQKTVTGLLSRNAWIPLLLRAVQADTMNAASISATQREPLLNHRDRSIATLAADVFETSHQTARADIIRRYQAALQLPADEAPGSRIFKRDCSTCHRVGSVGHAIGPDLTSSAAKDSAALLTHILDPNCYLLPTFETYVIVDTNGRTHTGMIAAQTATSVTLKQAENKTETILRGNIDEMQTTGKSLMPEGFEQKISLQEMADLLTFLKSAVPAATSTPTLDIGTLPGMIEPEG